MTDEETVTAFIRTNRTAAQRFFDALRTIIQTIKEALGGERTLAQTERLWKRTFEKAEANENAAEAGGGVDYNIVQMPDGKKYVEADRQVIFGDDPDSWSEQLEKYINGKIRKGENVTLIADNEFAILT